MKLELNVQEAACLLLNRIQPEYQTLAASASPFSLHHLLSPDHIRLNDYCQPFRPHPQSGALQKSIRTFCEEYGIWLPGAEHYLTCAIYLFPSASLSRITAIVKNNVIDFYLNDVMGREVFPHLPILQRTLYGNIKERMADLSRCMCLTAEAKPIEVANIRMLEEIADTSTRDWFDEFLRLYCYHIELAHKDCNTSGLGYIPDMDEYFEQRSHVSGMPHTVMLIEYSEGRFRDRSALWHDNIAQELARIDQVVSLIGCLMNDLFSFEKEVIDNSCDANLVMNILLNNPEHTLRSALLAAAKIVRDLLSEFFFLLERIRSANNTSDPAHPLTVYLGGLERCVQACWVWQVYTKRYKRPQSIWKETSLAS